MELISTSDGTIKLSVKGSTLGSGLATGLASSLSLGLAISSRLGLALFAERSNVGVEFLAESLDLERVALERADGGAGLLGAQDGLDFLRSDDTIDISVADLSPGQAVSLLGRFGAIQTIEGLEGGLGPDDEATNLSSRSELEEVQSLDGEDGDTGEIAHSKRERRLVLDDNEGTQLLAVATVAGLALAGAELLGVLSLDDISVSTDGGEGLDGELGLVDVGQRGFGDDARDFLDRGNAVTVGLD